MRIQVLLLLLLFFPFSFSIAQTCNNWLQTPSIGSVMNAGDLDIPGNAVTVEALINRTQTYLPGGGNNTEGDVVSKHNDFTDVNYLLRPNHAYITTTDGFFGTPDICDLQLNKTYHVALVYDGATLKFYRDGLLMSQVNASGNLILNNWQTRIGWYDPQGFTTQFIGYINEVRIWNVARTQTQIQTYMTTPLPTPATQSGLLAYYTFDNLLNKQGNTAYNGTLAGAASINQTNPACTLIRDSCNVVVGSNQSVIINTYTPVINFDRCGNKIVVEDASTFNAGDTVLIIQMKGAAIDSTNSSNFGTVTNYKNAGNYEFNIVAAKTANTVELKNNFLRQYDVPSGRVQLIRVPYFQDYTVTDTLTCLPWDGRKGGVLVLNVANNITMNGDINVSGRGFRGGRSRNSFSTTLTCSENGYRYAGSSIRAADKGESVYEIGFNNAYGKAPNASGGGGGVGHNSGGGGGGNGGIGGEGGYQLEACGNAPFDNRGWGGDSLSYTNAANKIFMGGGGGSGHTDNGGGIDMNGGNGGGIAMIIANTITNNGFKIISDGANGQACDNNTHNCHDGNGGGGGGGTVIVKANSYTNNINIQAVGGKGADLVIYNLFGAGRIGPGGGGGGGITWLSQPGTPVNISSNLSGGANGTILQDGNNAWGATAGTPGKQLFNLQIPVTAVPYKPNIDSVRIRVSATSCNSFNLQGAGFTNTSAIQSWQWDFGDNTTATTQNTSHTYTTPGSYTVKLVATDINGCKDSINTTLTTTGFSLDFSYSQNACTPLSVQFFTAADPAPTNPEWSFGDGGTNTGDLNPVHVYAATGDYTVKLIAQNGSCIDTVTKIISISIVNDDIIITNDTTICAGTTKKLFTKPALGFCWSPTTALDDPLSPNPVTSTTAPITYYFTAETAGTNIIVNGNFNAGNSGFTSGYNFASPNITEGQYFVGTNPQSWNGGLSPCGDHTTGNGNMLLVNGSPVPDVTVWTQTVTVTPNTNYAFATWIQALFTPNPAQLSFSINGKDIGSLITASLPTCTWSRFYSTWNSGNNTSAVISIVNKNTIVLGNDFALDDISFSPVTIRRDSVRISIDTPVVKAGNDTLVCEQNPVQLNATGAVSYTWLPAAGLNNPAISNPVATVTDTTQYIVEGITAAGCTASDTVIIFTKASPPIATLPDTGFCKGGSLQLNATGGTTYSWLPAAGLSNAGINNPVTTSDTTITYIVSGTGNGCTGFDTVKITVYPLPVVKTIADTAICTGSSLQLSATGANTYSWLPATGLNNAAVHNPITTPVDTTQYIVTGATTFGCTANDTVIVFTRVLPAVTAGNDVFTCAGTNVQLTAGGAGTYSWLPATGLNNPGISNPVAVITDTIQYIVRGTDIFGCSSNDTVIIFARPLPLITLTGDTTICNNTPVQLLAGGGISYQWLPATGLNNPSIANPVATATASTVYRVTVTGSNNCTAADSVQITVMAKPVFTISPNDSTCGNKPVQLQASGGNQYAWQPASLVSDASIANPMATAGATTTYTVIITENTCNISDTLTTTVKILVPPSLNISKSNDIDCAMPTAQLIVTGADTYTWQPAQFLNNASSSAPVATPPVSTLYTVTATDLATTCTTTDTITLFVNKAIGNNLFIPSAFTPNDDLRNDCWKPVYNSAATGYALTIYNRYGELVFYTEDINACWDGTYKGKKQDPGNFVYLLKIKNLCREELKKGNILLVR